MSNPMGAATVVYSDLMKAVCMNYSELGGAKDRVGALGTIPVAHLDSETHRLKGYLLEELPVPPL